MQKEKAWQAEVQEGNVPAGFRWDHVPWRDVPERVVYAKPSTAPATGDTVSNATAAPYLTRELQCRVAKPVLATVSVRRGVGVRNCSP